MRTTLTLALAAALLAGCDAAATDPVAAVPGDVASLRVADENAALATLRRATARYHNLDAALADGFFLLHDCEVRPTGAVGALYIHLDRYLDGRIDPAAPDGLLYAPSDDGQPTLAGVELALPIELWNEDEPPAFLGNTFQLEDEFGAFGLHIWLWLANPDGLFAEAHPDIACGEE